MCSPPGIFPCHEIKTNCLTPLHTQYVNAFRQVPIKGPNASSYSAIPIYSRIPPNDGPRIRYRSSTDYKVQQETAPFGYLLRPLVSQVLSHRTAQHFLTPLASRSRVKKIKCIQQPATGKCEACVSSNVPCYYRDREQYFAERTRLLSGGTSGILRDASANAQNTAHLSAIDAYTPTSSRGSSPSYMSRSGSSTSSTSNPSYSPFTSSVDISGLDINPFQTFDIDFDSQQSQSSLCVHFLFICSD